MYHQHINQQACVSVLIVWQQSQAVGTAIGAGNEERNLLNEAARASRCNLLLRTQSRAHVLTRSFIKGTRELVTYK